MIGKLRTGVTSDQPQTQVALFEGWIEASIEGAVKTNLIPGESVDADQLILALANKLGEQIARTANRDHRGRILAQVNKRLRHLADGGK